MGRPRGSKNRPLKLTIWLNQFNGIIEYMALDAEQRGVLLSIFIAYAQNDGLPSDTRTIAAACNLTADEIERALPGLSDYIDIDGDRLKCWYVDAEMVRMKKLSERGSTGAEARHHPGTSKSEKDMPEETEPQEDGVVGNAESKSKGIRKESETKSKGKPVDDSKGFFPPGLIRVPRAKVVSPPDSRSIARFIDSVCRDLKWDETAEQRTAWTRTLRLFGLDAGTKARDVIMRKRELGEPMTDEMHLFSKCLKYDIQQSTA